jgi:integrase
MVLRVHVLPRVGAVPLANLSRGDVQRLVDEIAVHESPETARKSLDALRALYRYAERDHDVLTDPCRGVRKPAGGVEREPRFLTPLESGELVAGAAHVDAVAGRSLTAPLLRLAVDSGLRLGELLALRWGDVDLDNALLRVERSLDRVAGQHGEPVYVAPKTRTSRRTIPLTRTAVAALRAPHLATGRPPPDQPVFQRRDGRPLEPLMMPRRLLRQALEQSRVAEPWPRFQDLRHSYATALLAAGVTVHAFAKLLGHSGAQLVLNRYGHALPAEVASAADALERARFAQDLPTSSEDAEKVLQLGG